MDALDSLLGYGGTPLLDPAELAALRQRQAVKPNAGRQEGLLTALLDSLGKGIYDAAASPSRLVNAHMGEYHPGVSVQDMPQTMQHLPEVALNVVGLPGVMGGVPADAIGSAAKSIQMPSIKPAVNIDGKIYSGVNHADALENAGKALNRNPWQLLDSYHRSKVDLDGFVTSGGQYLNRTDAAKYAQRTGIVDEIPRGGLVSENLSPHAEEVGLEIRPLMDRWKGALGANSTDAKTGLAIGAVNNGQGIRAYHGSPHDFDRFDLSKIGTGEGAQAYGHGLYFAENPKVAEDYRRTLASGDPGQALFVKSKGQDKKYSIGQADATYGTPEWTAANELALAKGDVNAAISQASNGDVLKVLEKWKDDGARFQIKRAEPGRMYEVNINASPEQFLDWDKPLANQPHVMQNAPDLLDAAKQEAYQRALASTSRPRADELWSMVKDPSRAPGGFAAEASMKSSRRNNADNAAFSSRLNERGIPGIQYFDQGSRVSGEGSRNFVVFSPEIIEILRKWGILGPVVGGAAVEGMDAR